MVLAIPFNLVFYDCVSNNLSPRGLLGMDRAALPFFTAGKSKQRQRDRDAVSGNSTALSLHQSNVELGSTNSTWDLGGPREKWDYTENLVGRSEICSVIMWSSHCSTLSITYNFWNWNALKQLTLKQEQQFLQLQACSCEWLHLGCKFFSELSICCGRRKINAICERQLWVSQARTRVSR